MKMNNINSIGDEEFTPFLRSLGVDTYNKCFEWMLSDPNFGDVLRWIYNNLDHNNALSAREECRHVEITKKSNLLSTEDVDGMLNSIQQEYSDICLPGDQERMDILKLDIMMQKERLSMLEKHETILKNMIGQNEVTKHELDKEIIKLNAAQHQCEEDEAVAAQECLQLAEEVDSITYAVVDMVTDTLNVYNSCCKDKETAKRFLTFGPFDTYRQSQGLFRSHFDLYTTKKFDKRNDDVTDDDLRAALIEAKNMEGRLSDALCQYIESKTELSGEQAKLALVSNYTHVHPSQITSCVMEAQSSLELLEQEESILEQQIRSASRDLVDGRTSLAVDTATHAALVLRDEISRELSFLVDVTHQALAVDRLLYSALRRELRALHELASFAAYLRAHLAGERAACANRLQSMNEISIEHETTERSVRSTDVLMSSLCALLGQGDESSLVQRHGQLLDGIRELKDLIVEGIAGKDKALEEYKRATKPLLSFVFDGCTKQPSCRDRSWSTLAYALRTELDRVDSVVLEASGLFQTVKNGDKRNLRKLWQWFLTEPAKLFAALRAVQPRGS